VYGDVNLDGAVNLGDVIFLLNYLFKAGPEPEMFILADINGDGKINLGDVIYLLNYLFKSGPPPPPPPSSTASLVPAAAKSAPEKIEVIRPVDFHSVEK
jgi:hypothetical protein